MHVNMEFSLDVVAWTLIAEASVNLAWEGSKLPFKSAPFNKLLTT